MHVMFRRWSSHLNYRPKPRTENRKKQKKVSKLHIRLWVIFLIVIVSTVYIIIDMRVMPVVMAFATSRARYTADVNMNEVVNSEIEKENIRYSDLFVIEKNSKGDVNSITANVVLMNRMKTNMIIKAQQAFDAINGDEVYVPLGSITGIDIFIASGPKIGVELLFTGSVGMDFHSNFEAVGINQTKHEIFLNVWSEVTIIMHGKQEKIVVENVIPMTSTVIVGNVPETVINGTTSITAPIN